MIHEITHRIELIGDKDFVQSVCIDCAIGEELEREAELESQIDDRIELNYHRHESGVRT